MLYKKMASIIMIHHIMQEKKIQRTFKKSAILVPTHESNVK